MSITKEQITYIVLEFTNKHLDWLNYIDHESALIQYYGDNREPALELHDTKQHGNQILKEVFEALQSGDRKTWERAGGISFWVGSQLPGKIAAFFLPSLSYQSKATNVCRKCFLTFT